MRHAFVASLVVALLQPLAAAAQVTPAPPTSGPTGVITGRIVGSGQPIQGALVTVVREIDPFGNGDSRLGPRNTRLVAPTNSRGEYRLADVPPGTYYVVALPPIRREASRAGHAISFYPGSLDASEARAIAVAANQRVTADIRVVPRRLSIIAGTAVGSNGRPLSGGQLQLGMGPPLFGVGGLVVPIESDGSFSTPPLAPGRYSLQTSDGATARAMSGVPDPVMSGARVTLDEQDVRDVRVLPIRMVRVRGRLVLRASAQRFEPSSLSIGATPLYSQGPAGPGRPGTARSDLTFEFRAWPGPVMVRVWQNRKPLPATMRLNGKDVSKTGIELPQDRDVSGLEIIIGH